MKRLMVEFYSLVTNRKSGKNNLQAVTNNGPFPWPVTFSFSRALQMPALETWKGDNNKTGAAQDAFKARLVANTEALKKK